MLCLSKKLSTLSHELHMEFEIIGAQAQGASPKRD